MMTMRRRCVLPERRWPWQRRIYSLSLISGGSSNKCISGGDEISHSSVPCMVASITSFGPAEAGSTLNQKQQSAYLPADNHRWIRGENLPDRPPSIELIVVVEIESLLVGGTSERRS